DIAERKHSEEELRHQLAFNSAITTHLGEGLCAMDREARVTFLNAAAERMLGWRESELLGRFIHDVIHFQRADGTPIPATECPLLGVMQSGTSVRIEEDVFTRRNGTVFPVSYTCSPIDTVRPAAEAKEIQIEASLEPATGTVSGDPDRLQQVVWNLLSNAIKFTPKGGRVQV